MSGRTKDKTRNLAFSKLAAHHTYLKWTAYDRPKPCELLVVHSAIAILPVYLFMIHVVRFFWELSRVTFMSEGFRFYCVVIVIGNRKDNSRQSKWPGQWSHGQTKPRRLKTRKQMTWSASSNNALPSSSVRLPPTCYQFLRPNYV